MNGTKTTQVSQRMSRKEARLLLRRIKGGLRDCRLQILELYERRGWKALGYSAWRECVQVEFGQSARHLYRLLQAAQVDRDLQAAGEELPAGGVAESHARELAQLDTAEERHQVYAEAQADGEVSAAKISEIIAKRQGLSVEQKSRIGNSDDVGNEKTTAKTVDRHHTNLSACWRVSLLGKIERVKDVDQAGARVVIVRPGDVLRLATE